MPKKIWHNLLLTVKLDRLSSHWFLWGTWFLILGLTSIFCWERVLYQDSAYALFKVLNLQNTIEHGRYIVPFVLWLGYIFSALSLPISYVVWGISIGNALWGFILTIYLLKKANNKIWAWSPALILLGTGPDFFFLGISEIIPALFLLLLFEHQLIQNHKFAFITLILAFFAHPGILPAVICLFAIFTLKNCNNKTLGINGIIFCFIVFLKIAIFKNSEYEQGIINKVNPSEFSSFIQSWGFDYFVSSLKSWLLPFLLFAGLIFMTKQPFFKKITAFIIILLSSLFIVFVYRQGDSYLMMQKSFSPMLLMSLTAYLILQRDDFQLKWVQVGIFLICVQGSILRINEGEFYRNRIKALDKKIEEVGIGKFITTQQTFPAEKYRVNWAISYESLIRSSWKNGPNKICTFTFTDSANKLALQKSLPISSFKGADFAYPLTQKQLRGKYFNIQNPLNYNILQ